MLKKVKTLLLTVVCVLSMSMNAFGSVEQLMIRTDSNALMTLSLDDDFGVMPASSVGTVTNTVTNDNVYLRGYYYDSRDQKNYTNVVKAQLVNGRWTAKLKDLDEGCWYVHFYFLMMKGSFPSPGVYKFSMDASSDFSQDYSTIDLYTFKEGSQADLLNIVTPLQYLDSSGDFYVEPVNLSVTNVPSIQVVARIKDSGQTRMRYGSFSFAINFTITNESADISTNGSTNAQSNYQDNMSSSLSDLSSSVGDLADDMSSASESLEYISTSQNLIIQGIDNVIMHISDQLYAFWDQLYNLIHEPTYAKLEEILGALKAIANNADIYQVVEEIRASNNRVIANDNQLAANQAAADAANTDKVTQAVEDHGNFIIDGLKGLFIPSDEFFKSYFDDLYEYFSERFGFLSFPIDLLIRMVDLFINSSDVDFVLTLPSFEISGERVWEDMSFNFSDFMETNFAFVLTAVKTMTSIGMIWAFVQLCQDKWDEVMRS